MYKRQVARVFEYNVRHGVFVNGRHAIDRFGQVRSVPYTFVGCLLYTSDAADDMQCVDLGGRRIIKKKKRA